MQNTHDKFTKKKNKIFPHKLKLTQCQRKFNIREKIDTCAELTEIDYRTLL